MDYLLKKLEEGYISIVSAQNFERLPNGKIVNTPFLYLRARNLGKPIVDLLSMKTTCASLTEDGCKFDYEHRPFGGKNLIPVDNGICYPEISSFDILNTWKNYQTILSRIVKRLTGMSVNANLRRDIENLFLDLFNENVQGVMQAELEDIKSMLPLLVQAYPQEYLNAQKKISHSPKLILKNSKK